MHYYSHDIKRFNNATRHLTRVERSLYRDLIELYYDTERPLPADDFDRLARRVLANTDEEKTALRYVLEEFFERTGDVWSHDKCDEIIEVYQASQSQRSAAGKASAEARAKKAEERKKNRASEKTVELNDSSTTVERPLNELLINNNKLIINKNTCAEKSARVSSQDELNFGNSETMKSNSLGGSHVEQKLNDNLCDELFQKFWCAGMRKVGGKPATKKVFDRLVKKQKDPVQFVDMLCRDIERRHEAGQNGFDLLHPKTYLNGHRWEDELPEVRSELNDHPEFDFFDLANLYNEKLGHHFGRISNITPGRQSEIIQSISFDPDKRKKMEWWSRCFDAISHSVLINPSENGWRPNFDFLIKSDTIEKLREGRYAIK